MWQRWIRMFGMELQWIKRDIIRRWRLDTPTGVLGILLLVSAVLLLGVIGAGFAYIFRSFAPWVSGARVGEMYWYSIGFGLKASCLFILFVGSLIMYCLFKLSERR